MEVGEKQIYNLWDTNGRRRDVLNALSVYLNILKDMNDDGIFDRWAQFPESLTQFSFYQRAIETSPEVFKSHPIFDDFMEKIGGAFSNGINKEELKESIDENKLLSDVLDKAIEQRARHYTSNLVRFGLSSDKRIITQTGKAYINEKIIRDNLESFLPVNDINIILLRQLMKLRIYSKKDSNGRKYYSPFFASIHLLLNNDTFGRDDFICIVQGLNPYVDGEKISKMFVEKDYDNILDLVAGSDCNIPVEFMLPGKLPENVFNDKIKNRKSNEILECYYNFYSALWDYYLSSSDDNYLKLKNSYINNKDKIKKAFCLGKTLFDFGTNGPYNRITFVLRNRKNVFLLSKNLNETFYKYYSESKYVDQVAEYSDTTIRVLGATGLFKFKTLPELSNKKLLSLLMSKVNISNLIFGSSSEEEYQKYENEEGSYFGSNISFCQILNYSKEDINEIFTKLGLEYGTTDGKIIKEQIENRTSNDFKAYVEKKYPKERIIKLLSMFSNRTNDSLIKKEINDSATVPTIYEYVVGIAWYYISNCDFDLYKSLNLTLNADFEPEMHAGGGVGDIVIDYPNKSVMLEVTLMNKAAQKRGEWEPVLRHSLNNKALNSGKESFTFFIADELDYNTINIWRAVAAAPLKSTIGDLQEVNGVVIMPFTNENIISFMNNKICSDLIIKEVKKSFEMVPKITASNWHEDIITNL